MRDEEAEAFKRTSWLDVMFIVVGWKAGIAECEEVDNGADV